MRYLKICLWLGFILMGIWALTTASAGNSSPTFHSFLTKDQSSPSPATRFSFTDRIAFQTLWTGLSGTHEQTVLWISPGGNPHQKNQLIFTVPSGTQSYSTSTCCLDFKKKRFFLSSKQMKYIGIWRVQLFLDGKLLSEYSFYIS
jgi:hypothetical protein